MLYQEYSQLSTCKSSSSRHHLLYISHANVYFELHLHPPGGDGWKSFMHTADSRNFAWVGAASSTFTLVAIAIERYFVVVFPHGNKGKRTIRKLKVCVSWLRRLMLLINCYCIVIALIALLLINPLNPKSTKFNN